MAREVYAPQEGDEGWLGLESAESGRWSWHRQYITRVDPVDTLNRQVRVYFGRGIDPRTIFLSTVKGTPQVDYVRWVPDRVPLARKYGAPVTYRPDRDNWRQVIVPPPDASGVWGQADDHVWAAETYDAHPTWASPGNYRLDFLDINVTETALAAPSTAQLQGEPPLAPGMPRWAQDMTFSEVQRYVWRLAYDKSAECGGPNCNEGTNEFLRILDLPGLEEGFGEADQAQTRDWLAQIRPALMATVESQRKVDRYLSELDLLPRVPQTKTVSITVEVPNETDVNQVIEGLGWKVAQPDDNDDWGL